MDGVAVVAGIERAEAGKVLRAQGFLILAEDAHLQLDGHHRREAEARGAVEDAAEGGAGRLRHEGAVLVVDAANPAAVELAGNRGVFDVRGTVVELLERNLSSNPVMRPKMFGCGPTPMLKALSAFAQEAGIECELSLEGDMACGVGLCQGCPVERANGRRKYALVCVEGPTFNCKEIVLR